MLWVRGARVEVERLGWARLHNDLRDFTNVKETVLMCLET